MSSSLSGSQINPQQPSEAKTYSLTDSPSRRAELDASHAAQSRPLRTELDASHTAQTRPRDQGLSPFSLRTLMPENTFREMASAVRAHSLAEFFGLRDEHNASNPTGNSMRAELGTGASSRSAEPIFVSAIRVEQDLKRTMADYEHMLQTAQFRRRMEGEGHSQIITTGTASSSPPTEAQTQSSSTVSEAKEREDKRRFFEQNILQDRSRLMDASRRRLQEVFNRDSGSLPSSSATSSPNPNPLGTASTQVPTQASVPLEQEVAQATPTEAQSPTTTQVEREQDTKRGSETLSGRVHFDEADEILSAPSRDLIYTLGQGLAAGRDYDSSGVNRSLLVEENQRGRLFTASELRDRQRLEEITRHFGPADSVGTPTTDPYVPSSTGTNVTTAGTSTNPQVPTPEQMDQQVEREVEVEIEATDDQPTQSQHPTSEGQAAPGPDDDVYDET